MSSAKRNVARILGGAALLALVAGACDQGTSDPCAGRTCSDHGVCEVIAGAPTCACSAGYDGDECDACADGYQDHDGDGACLPTCATEGRACPTHTHCDDTTGETRCVCDAGYQDHDGNGTCAADCTTAALDCAGHGSCDDSSGTAGCVCDAGYQDHDGDGTCLADCTTAALDCHGHGSCDDAGGEARCVCDTGYDRSDCAMCESAYYQDNDGDGVCTPTCYASALTFSCGENQVCSHATGSLQCVCATGYQDHDGNGTCVATCATAEADATSPLVCPSPNGTCDDSSGTPVCGCRTGYADDPGTAGDDCLACASGYQDNDDNGTCLPDCAAADLGCTLGCDDAGGTARCVCAAGEQDNDGDGICAPDCDHAGLVCDVAAHRVCDDASGTAACACDTTSYDDGMGTCRVLGDGAGDSCAAEIDLPPSVATVYADMTAASEPHVFGCDATGYAFLEVLYRIHIAAGETRRLRFTVDRTDAFGVTFTPAVAVLGGASCATATELACNVGFDPATYTRSAATVDATLDGGASGADYHLVVGLYDRRARAHRAVVHIQQLCGPGLAYSRTLDACVADPCDPVNPCTVAHRGWCVADVSTGTPTHECRCDIGYVEDGSGGCRANSDTAGESCADVTPLDAAAGEGSVSGSTTGAADDGEGSCAGTHPGPDRVYGFTLERETRVHFSLSCSSNYDCLMHLRRTCDDRGSEVLCNDRAPEGGTEDVLVTLPPGAYYLFVDGWNGRDDPTFASGDYTLSWSFHVDPCGDTSSCPADASCAAAADWSAASCVCAGTGRVLHDGACVDDPCASDPCAAQPHTVCAADYGAGTYTCDCGGIYVSDGAGGCALKTDAEWTIFWYLAMDNNLAAQTAHELDDAAAAALSPDVRVVALVDRIDETQSYYAQFTGGSLERVRTMGDVDTSDWHTLRDFGTWAIANYPARHYALVIADHGGAWKSPAGLGAGTPPFRRAICWDDDSPNPDEGIGITNGQLASALGGIVEAAGRKLDLVIYDACLMSEWEVADVTEPYADYMIASEDSSYGFMVRTGAWTDWLDALVAGVGALSPLHVAESFIDNYRATMATMSQYVTTAALTDLATVSDLDTAVSSFADALVAHEDDGFYDQLDGARRVAQHTAYDELVDLEDFSRLVGAMSGVPADVKSAADELRAQIDTSVEYGYSNVDLQGWNPYYGSVGLAGANGLTVYMPARYYRMAAQYTASGATWSERATWDDFLTTFLTGGYSACSGASPLIEQMPDTVSTTVGLTPCCGSQYLLQSFRAPGPELHGVRIAVRKTAADGAPTQGFYFALYRPGHGIIWGPAHWTVPVSAGTPQYFCMVSMGLPTEPGEEIDIMLGGGDPYPGDAGGFNTPIDWPIEYAASAGADPPYADGRARVLTGTSTDQTVGQYNGDGIEGTFWFEVY